MDENSLYILRSVVVQHENAFFVAGNTSTKTGRDAAAYLSHKAASNAAEYLCVWGTPYLPIISMEDWSTDEMLDQLYVLKCIGHRDTPFYYVGSTPDNVQTSMDINDAAHYLSEHAVRGVQMLLDKQREKFGADRMPHFEIVANNFWTAD